MRRLACLLSCLAALAFASANAAAPPRIATLDWTLAETLVALGAPPVALGQLGAYHDWVGEPRMPASVVDIGLRGQPNAELLADMGVDLILISPMFANLEPRLSRIAPVRELSLYEPDDDTWLRMQALTRELAHLAGRIEAGETLIDATREHLRGLRRCTGGHDEALLVVQFMDERHVRVFGENGLFQVVLDQLGLRNAWQGETNRWGFALTGIEALVGHEARIVVVRPYPAGVEARLARSRVWQSLPAVRDGRLLTLDPVWSFGALPSARRFAHLLTQALLAEECDA